MYLSVLSVNFEARERNSAVGLHYVRRCLPLHWVVARSVRRLFALDSSLSAVSQ
jgi:hypothetical protein